MNDDRIADAARRAETRERSGRLDPEPTLARRFGQMGVLGWIIVAPILLGVVLGSRLDRWLDSGIMYSAACLLAGACIGLWLAWRWMGRQ